jgi:hypothetical protein
MFEDESVLESGYADNARVGIVVGAVGSRVGGKYSKIEQILRAQVLTPQEKFMEAVQLVCYTDEVAFDQITFDKIAHKHPYPQYLNPRACVFAVNNLLTRQNKVKSIEDIKEIKQDESINILDAYRYAVLISSLLA